MPRKKASEVSTGRPVTEGPALRIHCPACKSQISADGATLHERSGYLNELIETDADVEKLEKAVGVLEGKLAAAQQELVQAKAEAQSKTEATKNEAVGPGQGKQRREWW